jgi:hypothetical protein
MTKEMQQALYLYLEMLAGAPVEEPTTGCLTELFWGKTWPNIVKSAQVIKATMDLEKG